MKVKIFYEETNFRLRGWKLARKLIHKVISKEGYISGDLNFILTVDEKLLVLNKNFLGRDYLTDVITFEYNEGKTISGDIFISIETVKINSKNYKVSYNEEIIRVMVHGVLHLCGYNDKTVKQKAKMREMENYWLNEWRRL